LVRQGKGNGGGEGQVFERMGYWGWWWGWWFGGVGQITTTRAREPERAERPLSLVFVLFLVFCVVFFVFGLVWFVSIYVYVFVLCFRIYLFVHCTQFIYEIFQKTDPARV
jgi:hypothetical protein